MRRLMLAVFLATSWMSVWAEEPAEDPVEETEAVDELSQEEATSDEPNGDGIKSPKTMSGMSILGNEEAPKSLVIIPWKSSRLGDEISLADSLDDRARPVDKDVFMRELRFHKIRAGEET